MTYDYLTATELSNLIGCKPTSYACMKRWLDRNRWTYVENMRGFPQVWRRYHDAKMAGESDFPMAPDRIEPNFEALRRS